MKKFDKSTRSLVQPDGSVYRIYHGKTSNCVILCTAVCYMEHGEKESPGRRQKL